jgi:hypothetical protein
MWLCDCCKIARFENLADACAHEEECLVTTAQEKLKHTREVPEVPVPARTVEAEDSVPATITNSSSIGSNGCIIKPVATFFQKGETGCSSKQNDSHSAVLKFIVQSKDKEKLAALG